MLIRPASTGDVPAVLPMVAKICALHEFWDSAKYGFLTHPEQRYEKWLTRLANSERSVFLVSENQAQLIGFLVATIEQEIPIYRLQEFAFIHDIWVESEYRKNGIARQMIIQAVERFSQMGIKQIRLDTANANEASRRLFASCGFRISTIEMLREL
ncbi:MULTISPECIES: GNAT family N-acetyltransferase [Nostoc]|uniref:GNAT family N-acetyltransferase n=1 Tax=Nostoc paludosum FACHB-159 TaxID=2692908 RepID=A0ABR8K6I1_9NOSO|nr:MULTISPECIES: GNAT family N-acetyltransferase [Nostoc]MBD2677934.1 GNAT family N-acetyltransferase [Nostoc sp. FACHB-857]MBD2733890.1 GNAT family N-acetyltransferase [Nostoc paludosum FACHB-159]